MGKFNGKAILNVQTANSFAESLNIINIEKGRRKKKEKSSSPYGVKPFTSYHTETNMVFLHDLLVVFCEYAALDGCFLNNLYARKYKINTCK